MVPLTDVAVRSSVLVLLPWRLVGKYREDVELRGGHGRRADTTTPLILYHEIEDPRHNTDSTCMLSNRAMAAMWRGIPAGVSRGTAVGAHCSGRHCAPSFYARLRICAADLDYAGNIKYLTFDIRLAFCQVAQTSSE
jgi:hypothetical protein